MKSIDPGAWAGTAAKSAETAVRIDILGTTTVRLEGDMTGLDLPQSSQELLGCLALHAATAPIGRERLSELLWPEVAAEASRHRLRSALWRLRKALGPRCSGVLGQNNAQVWLKLADPRTALPHLAFQAQIERLTDPGSPARPLEALTQSLALYSGPLLDGLDGDWLQPDREKFADLYLRGLTCQVRWYRAAGLPDATIDSAKTLLRHDPYREDVHAMLIGLYAATGQPRKALAQYRKCDGLLREELGVRAVEAQTALHTALLARGTPAGAQQAAPERELGLVLRGLQDSVDALSEQVAALRAALGRE